MGLPKTPVHARPRHTGRGCAELARLCGVSGREPFGGPDSEDGEWLLTKTKGFPGQQHRPVFAQVAFDVRPDLWTHGHVVVAVPRCAVEILKLPPSDNDAPLAIQLAQVCLSCQPRR